MANMSSSNAPDAETLGRVAGALAVDEAFVEKDWYVVKAICALVALETDGITPIFSGGTALLKGHALIRRFSEDIDFKLTLSDGVEDLVGNARKTRLSGYKTAVIECWEAAGFTITDVIARDGNGFIQIEMTYPTTVDVHGSLRPHILAELSAKPPRLRPIPRALASFITQYRREPPEVLAIGCVDPVETAADKLSAFTWRAIVRERGSERDDPAIVRHLHDLSALEAIVNESGAFPELLAETLAADAHRGGDATGRLAPRDRLGAALAILHDDALYAGEYARFVEGMAFAGEAEIPSFEMARAAVERICALLPA